MKKLHKPEIDFSRLADVNNRDESLKYLRWYIKNHQMDDDEHSDWMLFAAQLEAHYGRFHEDTKQKTMWKEVFKSLQSSETKLSYLIYKGDVLVRLAMVSLIDTGNLDDIVNWLNKAQEEDRKFFKKPEYRPAYKMLSFLQPLLMFRNNLWPPDLSSRRKIASNLYVLMPFCRGASAIAFKPDFIEEGINELVVNDERLKTVLIENATELLKISELCDKEQIFYKSMMFLVANIVEGILYNFCIELAVNPDNKLPDLERESIFGLARLCKKYGVIDESTEYTCRFMQTYRDFIHPARNMHHTHRLDHNFNKMFLFFFILLMINLAKGKDRPEI
jgi:hypothetical protein